MVEEEPLVQMRMSIWLGRVVSLLVGIALPFPLSYPLQSWFAVRFLVVGGFFEQRWA